MSDNIEHGDMALSGIRIIDFGQIGIDPITTHYLADFGAEVIKVESNSRLDPGRRTQNFVGDERDPNRNFMFNRYNQNKFGILLNLKHPKGVELAKKLVSIADVVTENFTVDVMQRLGVGYDELRKVKPDIIMLSASFGGQTGPYRDFRGQGFIIGALEGICEITGWPDRGPVSPPNAWCDHYVPYMWAVVILAALEYRRRTGKGQFIDGSTFEGCLDILDTAVADYSVNRRVLTRRGNHHPRAVPHGVYRCQGDDRWCAIAVFGDEEWQSFCRVLGNPAWASNERFSNLLVRQENADELDHLVEEWTREQKAEDLMLKLQQAGVAAAVAQTSADIYQDQQLLHRGHFWGANEPGMELFTFEAPPARLSRTPAQFQRRAPFLGEHNDYVYFELLGLDSKEYAQLVEEKVIF